MSTESRFDRTFVIAEMANAHEGDKAVAIAIVEAAASARADAVKFQVFIADELAVPSFSHYSLYQRLQMSDGDWLDLVEYGHSISLQVYADVFSLRSAELMIESSIDGLKIHSADVTNTPLLRRVGDSGLPILLSVGGSTKIEIADAVQDLLSAGAGTIVLMHGYQGYPTTLADSNLARISLFRNSFGLPVGFASHVEGGSPEAAKLPLWAAASGASVIEVHLTLDRSKKGIDFYSSLEPGQFRKLVEMMRNVEIALGEKSFGLSAAEKKYRRAHRKWLITSSDIEAGETLTSKNVTLKRIDNPPSGRVLAMEMAVGRKARNRIPTHSPIEPKDLEMKVAATLACRAESSRLYAKPMQPVGDRPILQHLIDRLRRVRLIDEIVLAISEGPSSCIFIEYARQEGLPYIVGSEHDVLKRLILAADSVDADIAIRVTTENPFVYWENCDQLIQLHVEKNADLTVTEKLPLGAYIEIISVDSLRIAHRRGEDRHRSELCTLFIAENPDVFVVHKLLPPKKLQRPEIRLTVDTPQDLQFVRTIWEALDERDRLITIDQIVDFMDAHPDIRPDVRQQTLHLWE